MSQYEVEVLAEVTVTAGQKAVVFQAAVAALENRAQGPESSCTILLTSDERIRELNRAYLDQDKPTDVLSFPAGEPIPGSGDYLGDIAISMPAAGRQARSGGHSLDAELQLLTVHAVLHLLGYDHATDGEKAAMWSAQAEILAELGAEITEPDNG